MKRLIYLALALLLVSLKAQAHYLYINLSHDAKPRSVMAHIGWGHTLPIDDFLQGDMLSSYSVYDPLNKRLDFKVDKSANANMESLIYTTKPTAGVHIARKTGRSRRQNSIKAQQKARPKKESDEIFLVFYIFCL